MQKGPGGVRRRLRRRPAPRLRSWQILGNKKTRVIIWSIIIMMVCDGARVHCPNQCTCRYTLDLSATAVLQVECLEGGMRSIPVDSLDEETGILIISAPPTRPNHLNIGPIFTHPQIHSNLKELHILHSNIPSIGQYSFWGLIRLRIINLKFNKLKNINPHNFRGLISLIELHLDHNNIKDMPSESFGHLTALKKLSLSHNEISTLVPRVFRMLAKLTYLDLSYNPLMELNPEVFKDVQQLNVFKCRRCLLQRVNTQIYYLAQNLHEVDIGENNFKYITADEFISLKKLQTLYLDGNQLSVIVDDMFGRNTDLRKLFLSRNRLALLAPAALTNLTKLEYLDISNNKMDRLILQTFDPVADCLLTVNFSGNNLSLFEIAEVLKILPKIQTVRLANLSLTEIPTNYFMYNNHLVELDLSWNKMELFPYELLVKTRFLTLLDISNNKISTLNKQDLQRLEAIMNLNLSENHWQCDRCSADDMIHFMTSSVLNTTIRELKCHSPLKLQGVTFRELKLEDLEGCTPLNETQVSLLAGFVLMILTLLAVGTTILYYTRRRRAQYYTDEQKRRERQHELPEELLGCIEDTPTSVATINAPYLVEST